MTESDSNNPKRFYEVLYYVLKDRGIKSVCDLSEPVQRRLLEEYGAIFLVGKEVLAPPTCMFTNEEQVEKFQIAAGIERFDYDGVAVELQPAALRALIRARDEARMSGFDITPRDGAEGARRSYKDTVRLWNSRFEPACLYWHVAGKLSNDEISRIKSLPVKEQVKAVLELEKRGIFFNTFVNNSILYSVAPPGTSQHLSMLAFDVVEFEQPEVRRILARYGWFRTVRNDAPHFTYLGRTEEELKDIGLIKIETGGGEYWIPYK